jgi:hypothetical protein
MFASISSVGRLIAIKGKMFGTIVKETQITLSPWFQDFLLLLEKIIGKIHFFGILGWGRFSATLPQLFW